MAASYRIPAVNKLNFAKPEEWLRCIKCSERFKQVFNPTSKSEEAQISTLVYSLEDKVEDILTAFNLKDEELKKYDTVKEKFENYFVNRHKMIYERVRFNSHTWRE